MPWIRPVASGQNALGDLSGQYWNVAQSNLRTQEGDIARANAAEQNWNRWNANVANLQRSDESTQYDRQAQADAMARRNFEWGIGRQDAQARDQLAATLDREKIAATLGLKSKQEAAGFAERENSARNLMQPVSKAGAAADTAEAIWQNAESQANRAIQELESDLVRFDPTAGTFLVKSQTDEAKTKAAQQAASEANARLTAIDARQAMARRERDNARTAFSDLQKQLQRLDLGTDKRDGQYVVIDLLAAPVKSEYRWTPPPSRGAMPASGESTLRTPGARWNAPSMEVQPQIETATMPSPAAAPVAPQVPVGSRVMPPGSPFMFGAGSVGSQPAPTRGTQSFASEAEARAAGHGSGDIIRIVGVGKVRLR